MAEINPTHREVNLPSPKKAPLAIDVKVFLERLLCGHIKLVREKGRRNNNNNNQNNNQNNINNIQSGQVAEAFESFVLKRRDAVVVEVPGIYQKRQELVELELALFVQRTDSRVPRMFQSLSM